MNIDRIFPLTIKLLEFALSMFDAYTSDSFSEIFEEQRGIIEAVPQYTLAILCSDKCYVYIHDRALLQNAEVMLYIRYF